jgi:hypothetical protein
MGILGCFRTKNGLLRRSKDVGYLHEESPT